jgi:hypothetical protein
VAEIVALVGCNIFCHRAIILPTARPWMTWLLWRKAIVSSDCRFLEFLPEAQTAKKNYFNSQLPLSIANSRTDPESSAYLPEIAWKKM